MKKKYPIRDVVGAAIIAFTANKCIDRGDLRRTTQTEPSSFSNREIMLTELERGPISQDYLEQADDVIAYLQQVAMLQSLTNGRTQNFLDNVVQLLQTDGVTTREFGLVSWAPKLASDYRKKDSVREKWLGYEFTSRFVGKVGDKVRVNFTLIQSHHLPAYNSYIVFGHDEHQNLFFFWNKSGDTIPNKCVLEGRIKEHKIDEQRNDAKTTRLNYVKVIE